MQPAVEAATALLGYAFSLHVRQQAAFVLSECIKCVATAAAKGEAGVAAADGAALVGGLLKPLSEARTLAVTPTLTLTLALTLTLIPNPNPDPNPSPNHNHNHTQP